MAHKPAEQNLPDGDSTGKSDEAAHATPPASGAPFSESATSQAASVESGGPRAEGGNAGQIESSDAVDEDRVRDRAYDLWNAAGAPEGEADRFWHEAVRQIQAGS